MVEQETGGVISTRERSESKSDYPPMPIVVGVGRSGTTLLRLMLDAHPDLSIPPETHFVPAVLELASSNILTPESFIDTVIRGRQWVDFHITQQEFRDEVAQLQQFNVSEALRCFYRLSVRRFTKLRYGDKTPPYNLHMLNIQEALPEAHFVHIIRDGRDVALSLRHLWFGPGKDIIEQARGWCEKIRESKRQAQNVRHYMEVRYEDLIRDTRKELEAICQFIDLPYHVMMESYHLTAQERIAEFGDRHDENGEIIVKKEQYTTIHRLTSYPPDLSRIQRWKSEMSEVEQQQFESVAGDMLQELGYETRFA